MKYQLYFDDEYSRMFIHKIFFNYYSKLDYSLTSLNSESALFSLSEIRYILSTQKLTGVQYKAQDKV